MPRPPKAKTAAKDSNGNFAWAWHSARHLAPQTARRDSAILQSEAIPQVLLRSRAAKNNMIALPVQLFYSTQIPVCLWLLTKNKAADAKRGFRDHLWVDNKLALAA